MTIKITAFALLLLACALATLYAPGQGTHWVGFFSYVPLLLVLERCSSGLSLPRNIALMFACALAVGISTTWGMTWPAASMHLFGGLPYWLARLIAGFGYGLEIGLILFIGFALPLLFIKRTNSWGLGVRLFWLLLVDLHYPRLIGWSFGGTTLFQMPWLEQGADLIGAWGLGFFPIGANLLIAAYIGPSVMSCFAQAQKPSKKIKAPPALRASLAVYMATLACFLVYGAVRSAGFDNPEQAPERPLHVVSVQPNFSFKHLSRRAELQQGEAFDLDNLLAQSQAGLERLPDESRTPRLLVWPESAFPWPFMQSKSIRAQVSTLAKAQNTSVLFAVAVASNLTSEAKPQALALWVNSKGKLAGVYEKITLMPFGEYIPMEQVIPSFGRIARDFFPMISSFQAGENYKLFDLPGGYKVAPIICFDATNPEVSRRMAANGADLIVSLANLVWFGQSEAVTLLLMSLRWRALENRLPVLLSTLTGHTQLITAAGKTQGLPLAAQASDVWTGQLNLRKSYAFYRHYAPLVQTAALGIFLLLVLLGHLRGQIFRK